MNTLFAIMRWLLGLFLGMSLIVAVVVTIPLSIAGQELFKKESGLAWINAFASDKDSVESFVNGLLESASSSTAIDDPMLKEALQLAANKSSPLGITVRKILSPESVGENLKTNAAGFYSWLEGESPTLVWNYKPGGTPAEQLDLAVSVLKLRYDALEACTPAQIKELGKVSAQEFLEIPCAFGTPSRATYEAAAKEYMKLPQINEVLVKGITSDSNATEVDRQRFLSLKSFLDKGILMVWLAIIVAIMILLILFTPRVAAFFATGSMIGLASLLLIGFGKGIGSMSELIQTTLGSPIAQQGSYLGVVALLLFVVGVWLAVAPKTKVEVNQKQDVMAKEAKTNPESSRRQSAN